MTNTIRKIVAQSLTATHKFRRRLRNAQMAMKAIVYGNLPRTKRRASNLMKLWNLNQKLNIQNGNSSQTQPRQLPADSFNGETGLARRVLHLPEELKLCIIRYVVAEWVDFDSYKMRLSQGNSASVIQEIITAFTIKVVPGPDSGIETSPILDCSLGRILQSELLRSARLVTLDVTNTSNDRLKSITNQHQPIRRIRLVGRTYVKPRDGVARVDPFLNLDLSPPMWLQWRLLRHIEIDPQIWDCTTYHLNGMLHISSERTSVAQLIFDYYGTVESFRDKVRVSNNDIVEFRSFNQPRPWYLELEKLARSLPMMTVQMLVTERMWIEENRFSYTRVYADRLRFTFANESNPVNTIRFEKWAGAGPVCWDVTEPWI